MKTFCVAVLVAIVLTFICIQESSAISANEMRELVEAAADDGLSSAELEAPEESWKMPYEFRQRRAAGAKRCRFCCGCCPRMRGCGVCCRF